MIKGIDLAVIIPILASLLSFLGILLHGKKTVEQKSKFKILQLVPFLSVAALIFSVFFITDYYEKQEIIQNQAFSKIQNQNFFYDSILLSNKGKLQVIDSLRKLDEKLKTMLIEIKKQEKIIGNYSNITEKIKDKIIKTNQEIGEIQSYNEIVEKPKYLLHGFSYSGNTSNFSFSCPTDKTAEFIDLKLAFQDTTLIQKIDCIYIEITEVKEDGKNWLVFEQAYKPKSGVNAFKIRNYLNNKTASLLIGYILKSEMLKENPTIQKVSCESSSFENSFSKDFK